MVVSSGCLISSMMQYSDPFSVSLPFVAFYASSMNRAVISFFVAMIAFSQNLRLFAVVSSCYPSLLQTFINMMVWASYILVSSLLSSREVEGVTCGGGREVTCGGGSRCVVFDELRM